MAGRTVAVLATAIWGILAIPGLLGAALSPMFFDAPGSMNNLAAWMNALIVASFPLLCIASIAATWLLRSRSRLQLGAACLPLIPIVYVAGALVAGTVGALFSGQPLGLHSTVIKP